MSRQDAISGIQAVYWGSREYLQALQDMMDLQQRRIANEIPDTFVYVEHLPVITYGRAATAEDIAARAHQMPSHEVGRGGLATYHGPGQLVGYGIVNLAGRAVGRPDIHDYIRALEQGMITFLDEAYSVHADRRDQLTGVWIGERKIASIGVSARRWVTAHGFALNISTNLSAFRNIIPCGIKDCEMTSVERELAGRWAEFAQLSMEEITRGIHPHICDALAAFGWSA